MSNVEVGRAAVLPDTVSLFSSTPSIHSVPDSTFSRLSFNFMGWSQHTMLHTHDVSQSFTTFSSTPHVSQYNN
jgi:hypothetical protein